MRLALSGVCSCVVLVASGCAAHRAGVKTIAFAPVLAAEQVRESLPGDYLRVSFLPAGVMATSLSRPGAIRAFATATILYIPPLKVKELPYYSGLVNDEKNVLVAMRCRPEDPAKVDAVLATWPNVFLAIERDVPVDAQACTTAGTPEGRNAQSLQETRMQAACFARGFRDPAGTAVPITLARTMDYAAIAYDSGHTALAKWLQDNYGLFPAFSGLGYSVKDSYTLTTQAMTSGQILAKSLSSEYMLKNVSLADAGCRCIAVPPYPGRSEERLDPEYIARAGGAGTCRTVDRLQATKR